MGGGFGGLVEIIGRALLSFETKGEVFDGGLSGGGVGGIMNSIVLLDGKGQRGRRDL